MSNAPARAAGGPLGPEQALALVIAVAVAWNLIGNLLLPSAWYVPANLIVAALVVAVARQAALSYEALGLAPRDLGRGAMVGFGAALAIAVVIGLGLLLFRSAFEDPDVAGDNRFDRWFVPLARIPLGTAVYEEVLFRSAILGLLLVLRGRRAAVLWSSLLFGLWHVVPAWETSTGSALSVAGAVLGTVAVTTAAGIGFSLLRVWSRSVLAAVIAHSAISSFAYLAALVALDVIG